MRKKSKWLAAVLAAAMVLSCAACGNSSAGTASTEGAQESAGKNDGESSSDTLVVDVFTGVGNFQGTQGGWFGKLVKDKFNIELNLIAPNVAGGGDTLYQTRSAAGNLGDIIIIKKDKLKDCIDAGIIYDMTDLMKNSTYLKQFEVAINGYKEYAQTDRVYGIPTNASLQSPLTPNAYALNPQNGSYMRWDYYKELGCPEMEDYDDMLDVLKQMQDAHPTSDAGTKTYAFSLFKDWDGSYMKIPINMVYFYGWGEGSGFVLKNGDATKTQLVTEDEGAYYQALKTLFKANQMGLVDPDSSTQNWDSLVQKVKDGAVLFSTWPWASADHFNTAEKAAEGIGFAYVPVADQKLYMDGLNPYGSDNNIIAMGAGVKDPERIFAFLDWMASPEYVNCLETSMGPEGYAWEMKEDGPVLTEYGKAYLNDKSGMLAPDELGGGNFYDGFSKMNTSIQVYNDINPETGESYMSSVWPSTLKEGRSRLDEEWSEAFGYENALEYIEAKNMLEVGPGSDYTAPADSSDIANKRKQCGDLIVSTSWKMVFAKDEAEFEELWKNMKADLTGYGYEDVVAVDREVAEGFREARARSLKDAQ